MTDERRPSAERLRYETGFTNVTYVRGCIREDAPERALRRGISNGAIKLSADKSAVFREAALLLKRGSRIALSDIVTEVPLPDDGVCNAMLWAAWVGGAMQHYDYRTAIDEAGFAVEHRHEGSRNTTMPWHGS